MLHIPFSLTGPNIRLKISPFERVQKVLCFLESSQVLQPYMRVVQLKALHSICLVISAISEEYASLAMINLLWKCESSLLSSTIQDPKYTKLLTSSVFFPPIFKP